MRDLRVATSENGAERLALDDLEPTPEMPQTPAEVKRDQTIAEIVVMVLDACRILEPLVEVISARLLRWATLGVSAGLAVYALRQPSWERLAVLGVFMVLAPWILRKSP